MLHTDRRSRLAVVPCPRVLWYMGSRYEVAAPGRLTLDTPAVEGGSLQRRPSFFLKSPASANKNANHSQRPACIMDNDNLFDAREGHAIACNRKEENCSTEVSLRQRSVNATRSQLLSKNRNSNPAYRQLYRESNQNKAIDFWAKAHSMRSRPAASL